MIFCVIDQSLTFILYNDKRLKPLSFTKSLKNFVLEGAKKEKKVIGMFCHTHKNKLNKNYFPNPFKANLTLPGNMQHFAEKIKLISVTNYCFIYITYVIFR